MAGLDPEDPRFEHAVQRGLAAFIRNPKFQAADMEDLAQEIRIALLERGAPAPVRVAKLAAIDWWRAEYGRWRPDRSRYDGCRGHRRMELLTLRPRPSAKESSEDDDMGDLSIFDLRQSQSPSPEVAILWARAQRYLPILCARHRTMLLMRYVNDCNMKEIGQHLGVSESRVVQLMPEAHQALQDSMGQA